MDTYHKMSFAVDDIVKAFDIANSLDLADFDLIENFLAVVKVYYL